MAVNLLVGGGRMFPPFFRDPAKLPFNRWSLARLAEILRSDDPVIVGFHPEGRRNREPSPYTPLPAQPGVGKIIMDSWPVIIPAFINGLTNNIAADIVGNFRGTRTVVAVETGCSASPPTKWPLPRISRVNVPYSAVNAPRSASDMSCISFSSL